MWAAYTKAIAELKAAKREHQGLGVGAISSDAPRSAVLEATMITALATRDIMEDGIQAARWDTTQWKYSPGALAQLLVIATFITANKKIALSRISQAYFGMDLELLVGEPVNPAELSDGLGLSI